MSDLYFAFPDLPEKLYMMSVAVKDILVVFALAAIFGLVLWAIDRDNK